MNVTRFEAAFPDLKWKILKGQETRTEADGQPLVLFTAEDGTTYSELLRDCSGTNGDLMVVIDGQTQPLVQLETLAIPDLKLGGYPTVCVAAAGPVLDPKTGEPIQMELNAGTINSIPEPPGTLDGAPLTLTIETVELVYYTPNQSYYDMSQSSATMYMQPAWRFYGHFSDGTPFEALVQALDPVYLLPELDDPFFPG
jgi:hypothetical protein